jgi:hypothetical protein
MTDQWDEELHCPQCNNTGVVRLACISRKTLRCQLLRPSRTALRSFKPSMVPISVAGPAISRQRREAAPVGGLFKSSGTSLTSPNLVTYRFTAHNGLNSDIAACLKSARAVHATDRTASPNALCCKLRHQWAASNRSSRPAKVA